MWGSGGLKRPPDPGRSASAIMPRLTSTWLSKVLTPPFRNCWIRPCLKTTYLQARLSYCLSLLWGMRSSLKFHGLSPPATKRMYTWSDYIILYSAGGQANGHSKDASESAACLNFKLWKLFCWDFYSESKNDWQTAHRIHFVFEKVNRPAVTTYCRDKSI